MNPTEQTACLSSQREGALCAPKGYQGAKIRSPRTGIFATLRALLPVPFRVRAQGTGAPSRLALAFALSLSALALTAAPAFAAPPEAPELTVEAPVKATEAVFLGTLSPKSPGELGSSYKFLYKASKTKECQGGSETLAGMALGAEHEVLPAEPVSGLTANTEYAVCLLAENAAKTESASSAAVAFKTATPPEKPVTTTPAKSITGTTATLEGSVNPVKEAVTGYFFAWAAGGKCSEAAEGGTSTPVPPAKLKAFKASASATALQPNRKYVFCLVATNAAGETAPGNEVSFTTSPSPPTIVSESTSNVKAEEATLEGVLNPNNQVTECHFQYGLASGTVSEHEVPCSPELVKGFGELSVTPMKLNEKGESVPAPRTGLEPGQAYRYRIVAKNGKGEESIGPEREFKRLLAPPEKPETDAAETITNTTAVLHGVVNPSSPSSVSWFFQYAPGASCSAAGAGTTPAQGPEEVQVHSAEAKVTGLQPGTLYTVCLVAENEAKEKTTGNEIPFTTTTAAPSVTEESVSHVGSTEATVGAQINPGGVSTTYKVEYGTSEPYASSSEASLPAAEGSVGVLVHLTGLTPSSEYHFRFVAVNAEGTSEGTLLAFTTPSSGGPSALTLPDNRVYELVSPPSAGEVYVPTGPILRPENPVSERPFQASSDGGAVSYVGDPSSSEGSGLQGSGAGNQFVARRSAEGWRSSDVATPAGVQESAGDSASNQFQAFAPDLTYGVIASRSKSLLLSAEPQGRLLTTESGAPNCRDLFARSTSEGSYSPLFTTTDTPGECGSPLYAGTSADGIHSVFQTQAALVPGAEPGLASEAEPEAGCYRGCNLYDSTGGQLRLVNILPGGEQAPDATLGGSLGPNPVLNTTNPPGFQGVVSANGSRIFWTDLEAGANFEHVYVREDGARTVQVSGEDPAKYWTATPDGRYAYYTENEKLWRYALDREAREELAPAGVQGVLGINVTGEDGAYVYFVSTSVLAGNTRHYIDAAGEAITEGAREEEGIDNLYVRHGGQTSFIAELSSTDDTIITRTVSSQQFGDWVPNDSSRTAEPTPDGHSLVFESTRQLTGYDNSALAKEGAETSYTSEVFAYDSENGQLSCASCSPTGSPPVNEQKQEPGRRFHGFGTYLPVSWGDTYLRRWISADGSRVFFDTSQPLVPQDGNGSQDVYEWERAGTSSCPQATSIYGGCVFLLSAASSSDFSYFVDADESGDNAFFITRAELVPQDRNEKLDLYDARVGGGFAAEASRGCPAGGCQSQPLPAPSLAPPSTITFAGSGNLAPPPPVTVKPKPKPLTRAQKLTRALRACKHARAKKRRACERQARKRYGAKSKPRGHTTRRSG